MNVKTLIDDLANSVIQKAMTELRIGIKDLTLSRMPHHCKARKEIIKRLAAVGISELNIARIMHLSPSTVSYWKRPTERARRLAKRVSA